MNARVLLTRAKYPPYMPVLVVLTILYLLSECAFNARLLDVVSGLSETLEIDQIEFWGRILSGLAVALAVCGSFVLPLLHKGGFRRDVYMGMSLLVGIPCLLAVFYGEKHLIDWLIERSTQRERRIAAMVSMASTQLRIGRLHIQGLDLNEKVLNSPEGKSFIALFSPFVAHLPDAETIILREVDSLIRQYVDRTLGGLDAFYHGAFNKSFEPLQEQYKRYASGVNAYREQHLNVPQKAEAAWNSYVNDLARRRVTPARVPQSRHAEVRMHVRRRGVPVPDNWHPADKAGFLEAYQQNAYKILKDAALTQAGGMPLDLKDFDAFLAYASVQKKWKDGLGMPAHAVLKNGMSKKDFERLAYIPLQERLFAEQKRILLADAAAFADGGKHMELGKSAMRGIIVPPLALFFSLVGIIIHVCKSGFYGLRLVMPFPRLAALINLVAFIFLMCVPMFLPNSIADSGTFQRAEAKIAAWNHSVALTMNWIIRAQSYMYPVNAKIQILWKI